MEKELLAALAGGVVGVLGSLLSVAIGYYLQTKFALKQSEQQRALHQEQIDNERAIHKEQIAHQKALIDASIKRENNLRMIDMLMRDIDDYYERLRAPNLPFNEQQGIHRRIDLWARRREQLLREEGIELIEPKSFGI